MVVERLGSSNVGPCVTAAVAGVVAGVLGYAGVHLAVLLVVVVAVAYTCPRLLELWWRARTRSSPR